MGNSDSVWFEETDTASEALVIYVIASHMLDRAIVLPAGHVRRFFGTNELG